MLKKVCQTFECKNGDDDKVSNLENETVLGQELNMIRIHTKKLKYILNYVILT